MKADPFGAWGEAELAGDILKVARLRKLEESGIVELSRLPYSVRVLLENVLRRVGDGVVTSQHLRSVVAWSPNDLPFAEIPFVPSRVLLQDLTGIPGVVDLAALRDAVHAAGGDPQSIDSVVPVDFVVDHSVQVDYWGSEGALERNMALEIERNSERYKLIRWAQNEFRNLRVIPMGTGIVHQINVEHLASVVQRRGRGEEGDWAFPDTVVGTDSHTPMVNGIGVLGWGVGGIEAEAVMLGQPIFMLLPEVVGVRLSGSLPAGATTTDLALSLTQRLRALDVVGSFVEFFGPGASALGAADRATVANMAPEYGATCGFFPVDGNTVQFLRDTGRSDKQADLVEQYTKLQTLYRDSGDPDPEYTRTVDFDLASVRPSIAGPRRPQDRISLGDAAEAFRKVLPALAESTGRADTTVCSADVCLPGAPEDSVGTFDDEGGAGAMGTVPSEEKEAVPMEEFALRDGAVVIAALTSCTNTSNPSVMMAAGLLAKKAVEAGLSVPAWVKTSLGPGSLVVTAYLRRAGLLPYLERLGFNVVGYGCTTCIGNSGPLPQPIADAIRDEKLVTAAVVSGNRNFEARIHALVRANYLASPPLVVAYALAGNIDVNLETEPLGRDTGGNSVYLADIWPSPEEVGAAVSEHVSADSFRAVYSGGIGGSGPWQEIKAPRGALYQWDRKSTYIQNPPFFQDFPEKAAELKDIEGARPLAIFGDSVTTDHISPAGAIPVDSDAGRYLVEMGVAPADFNTFGSRRGNHEVLMRGTFANIRVRNKMAEGREGGWTKHHPSGDILSIYEAAQRYKGEKVPLIIIAGKEYGTGSSRDWAAKGPALLGVRAVIAESYERIHRSNLVGMGIIPLQFEPDTDVEALGLTGAERLDIKGLEDVEPGGRLLVHVRRSEDDTGYALTVRVRLDSPIDLEYYRHGGILHRVLRGMLERRH